MTASITELIGIYHADGGAVGEVRYVIGKLLGTAHCSLCDITHSSVRRKPDWDTMVARVGLPFRLLHLNELPSDVAAYVKRQGSPIVLGRVAGGLVTVLEPSELDSLGGSITSFESALRSRLDELGRGSQRGAPLEVTEP